MALSFVVTPPVRGEVVAPVSSPAPGALPPRDARTQFVLLGFDATPSAERPLRRQGFHYVFRALNRDRREGPPNAFTLFISTGHFQLTPGLRRYRGDARPFEGHLPLNRPVIRYARGLSEIQRRAANVREISELGVEISSHGVRHRRGLRFSDQEWREEIDEHARITSLAGLPSPVGFRAPFLEHNRGMYAALAAHGVRYDASRPGARTWPTRDETGIWLFPIPSVSVPGSRGPTLFFDDNLRTVMGEEAARRGLEGREAEAFMDRGYVRAARAEFDLRYRGERAPLLLSGHGNFRGAILRFMRGVCGRPQVRCASFREATDYLDAHPGLAGR